MKDTTLQSMLVKLAFHLLRKAAKRSTNKLDDKVVTVAEKMYETGIKPKNW